MSDQNTQQVFSSMRQASGATDIALSVLRAAKAAGCPGFTSAGRVDLAQVRPWLEIHAEEMQGEVDENSREFWSLEKLKYQAKREQLAFEHEQGLYLKKDDVASQLKAIAAATKAQLKTTLEDELPAKIVGLDAIGIKEVMAKTVDDVCRQLQGVVVCNS